MHYRVEICLAAIDSTLSGLPERAQIPAVIRYILEQASERVLFRPIAHTNAGERQLRGINVEISESDISQEAKRGWK